MEYPAFEGTAPTPARWGLFTESDYRIIGEALRRAHLTFMAMGMQSAKNAELAVPALTLAIMQKAKDGERDAGVLAGYAVREFDTFVARVTPRYFQVE